MSEYNDETIEEPFEDEALDASPPASGQPPKSDYDPTVMKDSITHHLSGMYQNWFLDYASYVIELVLGLCLLRDSGTCSATHHGWFETCAATHSPLDEADG